MNLDVLGTASGYLGAALSVGMVVPQLVRTMRSRGTGGVSAPSWALTTITCLTWLIYGVKAGVVPQIPGNMLIVPGAAAIVLLVPAKLTVARRAMMLAAAASGVIVAATFLPTEYIGYLAFLIGLLSSLPQAIESVWRSRSAGGSAVSVPAWLMRGCSQVFWLGYALTRHDVPIMVAAVVTLASAVVLVAAERSASTRRAMAMAAAGPTLPAWADLS